MITEAQRNAYLELKEQGEMVDVAYFKETTNELCIYHSGGEKITAIHTSGIVTIHRHTKIKG